MNNTNTGEIRPNFDEIANQILEAYGCVMADEQAPTSFPKWKWRKLLAEAASMGVKQAAPAPDLARLSEISLTLGTVSAQLEIGAAAPMTNRDDGEVLQIALDGTRRLLDDALCALGDLLAEMEGGAHANA